MFACWLGSSLCASAAEPWVSLFNGKDLSGWRILALGNPAPVAIENGEIVLRQLPNTKEHSFVATDGEYEDFILELELKNDPHFNSGILLRCADSAADAKVRINGYQVKIDDTPRAWTGGIFDDFGDSWRWLHDLADDEKARAAFKLGEWTSFRIECIGGTIKVWVNQAPTSHLVDGKYAKGRIAFKIHSAGNDPKVGQSAMRLRNIRVIAKSPELHLKPMSLPPRTAPTVPGKFDKAKPSQKP